jgi:hypothetical protein
MFIFAAHKDKYTLFVHFKNILIQNDSFIHSKPELKKYRGLRTYFWFCFLLYFPSVSSAQTDAALGIVLKNYINKELSASLSAAQKTANSGEIAFSINDTQGLGTSNYSPGTNSFNLPSTKLAALQLDVDKLNLCRLICVFFEQDVDVNYPYPEG